MTDTTTEMNTPKTPTAANVGIGEANPTRFNRGNRWTAQLSQAGLGVAIVLAVIVGALTNPAFLTVGNFVNVLTSMSIVGIIVVGMTFVLVVGGMADLSVPATIATGAILSLALQPYVGVIPAFVIAVGFAGLTGAVNGWLIGWLGINPIIATLGMGTVVLGLAQAAVGGVIVYGTDPASAEFLKSRLFGIPMLVWIFIAIAAFGHYLLSYSWWGRWTIATGGNGRAAEASAVPVKAVRAGAFVITAIMAGISGGILGLTLQNARPLIGTGYEFSAITAVVVGGVSIMGGHGSVPRAVAGLIFVQLLTNILVLNGVKTPVQGLILGLLIVVAVALDLILRKRGIS